MDRVSFSAEDSRVGGDPRRPAGVQLLPAGAQRGRRAQGQRQDDHLLAAGRERRPMRGRRRGRGTTADVLVAFSPRTGNKVERTGSCSGTRIKTHKQTTHFGSWR